MDPNHWNQYNQAYGRLASGASMAGGSAPLNRYDLGLLDQSGIGTPGMSGLGTLSPSLGPAHTLSPARGMPGLPNLNYGHPVHSSMSQLLDTMNSLGQGFPNAPTYKSLPPTSQHMYGLPESIFLPDQLGDSQMTKQSLFNTDPHTMKETASEAGAYGTVSTPSDAKSSWGLSNFVPPPSNPFGSISESPTSVFSLTPEPPPAHSGSRPSTIQRNPYQKPEYQPKNDFQPKSDFPVRTEHSSRSDYQSSRPNNSDFHLKPEYRSEFPPKQEYHAPSVKPDYRQPEFPSKQEFQSRSHVKSEYQSAAKKSRTSSGHSQSLMNSVPRTTGHGMQPAMNQSQSSLPRHSSYPSSPQVSNPSTYPSSPHMRKPQVSHSQHSISEYNPYYPASSGFSSAPSNTVTYTSGSNIEPLTYDPVSPPSNLPNSRSHNSNTHNFGLSLQEFTNMSNQDKLHLTDAQSHMASSSPIRVQNKIQGMGGVASTPSPMQPSPISVGSPQVPMASPHNHMSGQMASPQMASSSVPPVPIPVQAVADSTTKPKRSRNRKKKEKTPDLKMMYPGPPPPLTSPHPMTSHQQLTPHHSMTTTHMLSEPNDRYSMSESDTSMYMANSYEETFMSPSQLLGDAMMPLSAHGTDTSPLVLEHHPMHHDLESPVDSIQTIDPNALMDTGFGHGALHNLDTMTYQNELVFQKQQKQKRNRTKAEQKEMPGAYFMAPQEMPVQQRGFQVPQQAEIIQDDEFTHLQRDPLNEGPKQTVVPKKGTGVSSFQSSFLSFLQGNKQETLSCITNSVVSKKPITLPKNFTPEAPRLQPDTFEASPNLLIAESDLKMKALDKSIDVPAVTFSDDEDNSMAFSNTVQNVISNLSDDSKSEQVLNNPTSETSQQFSFLATEHASSGAGKSVAINPPVPKATKPKTVVDNDADFLPSNDVVVNEDDMLMEKRILAARKTKEKKVKAKKHKKKRKKKWQGSDTSGSSDSEKGYDSDKDPVWMPFETEGTKRRPSSDSDNDNKGRKNKKDRKSSSSKSSKRSKTYKNVGVINTIGGVLAARDGASHKFQKGDFVVENKVLVGNSYPVWKIDAGRLLQKFEPFDYMGIKCHKGLSTYSSWSPELKDQYKAIQVQTIQSDSYELVQIIQKSQPNGQVPDDPLLEDFNVYMQILISRALEASFLQVVQEEGEDFYLQPLQKVDALIEKNKESILGRVNWTEKFRESVERRPYMNCVDRLGLSKACQACQDHSQPAIKSVELYGTPYNLHTLDTLDYVQCPPSDEFLIGELTATYLSTYHGLHHFKFSTFKRCTAKVDLIKEENPEVKGHEILDQCLQNRNWVLKIFQDFKRSLSTCRGSNSAGGT
ncbi:uncharacterized protein LOC135492256 [Lineus longissimus]|uniref:uncharacterized protein LOC135492256 n=1 Tax=Lineus longissimus TaxID=88925 RepID=UPI002B4D3532